MTAEINCTGILYQERCSFIKESNSTNLQNIAALWIQTELTTELTTSEPEMTTLQETTEQITTPISFESKAEKNNCLFPVSMNNFLTGSVGRKNIFFYSNFFLISL